MIKKIKNKTLYKKNSCFLPKETACWLVDNTALTFEQIANFTKISLHEVQLIADGNYGEIVGLDPTINGGPLTKETIDDCTKDPTISLWEHIDKSSDLLMSIYKKRRKYIPISRRQDKPDAIAWLLKHYPDLDNNSIIRLVGTTNNTINSIKDKTHWNVINIQTKSPVDIGLCTKDELEHVCFMSKTNIEKQKKMKEYEKETEENI